MTKLLSCILLVTTLIASPCIASPKIKAPQNGTGLVVIELSPAGPSATDFVILTGGKKAANDETVQTRKLAMSLRKSFPLYVDQASGKAWFIDNVPAGQTVIYGMILQENWQIRFDHETPQFTVPDGGYVFIGSVDAYAMRQRILDATAAGKLPESVQSYNGMTEGVALCGQNIENYTAPTNTDALADAKVFLEKALQKPVNLVAADVSMKPFKAEILKLASGPSHRCVETKP
jgi:hypothetical protein